MFQCRWNNFRTIAVHGLPVLYWSMLEHIGIGRTYLAYYTLHIPSYEGFILYHSLKLWSNPVEEIQFFITPLFTKSNISGNVWFEIFTTLLRIAVFFSLMSCWWVILPKFLRVLPSRFSGYLRNISRNYWLTLGHIPED